MADSCDPLAVQVALAKGMLDADRHPPSVFFVDEHFVSYTGSRPVQKGWNTRRRHAEPGRHDTVIVADRWRVVCFASTPPQGLAAGMLGPVDRSLEVCGGRPVMVGFDRGGSYPRAFKALDERHVGWVTYRRAPLTAPTVRPTRRRVTIQGQRHHIHVADEVVALPDYGPCRQLSVFEHGRVVLQILTSDEKTPAALLAWVLRCRWRIENTFKYLEDRNGLHWLCDYQTSTQPDTRMVRNPRRTEAVKRLRDAEHTLAQSEQKLGQHHTSTPVPDSNPAETRCMLESDLYQARNDIASAKALLKEVPAKLPANQIDPDAMLATPRVNRRALQTVLRLLAYNAELDLARALNTYLQDIDEYRTTARHLLRQPGQITYTPTHVTVTIDQPHTPRIHQALSLLIEQINNTPPTLAGDPHRRPISYQIAPKL